MDDHAYPSTTKGAAREPKWLRVAAAVVWRGDALLLTQRPPGVAHPLAWEFPGGKIEPGESAEQALRRELREELGVEATPHEHLGASRHTYSPELSVEVAFIRCTLAAGALVPSTAVHALRWVRPADVDPDDVLAADRAFLAGLAASASRSAP